MARRLVSVAQARRGFGFIDMQPDGSVQLNPDVGALSVGGNVAIKGPRPYIDPTHPYYGADPTGSKAASDALNNAFADAVAEGTSVAFPAQSKFNIDKQLLIQDASGLSFGAPFGGNPGGYTGGGAGPIAVQLIWNGASGGNPIYFNRCRDSVLRGFQLVPGSGSIGIGIDYDASGTITNGSSTNNQFDNITIINPQVGGLRIGHSQVGNCSETMLYSFNVSGTSSVVPGSYGINIEYFQSYNTRMFGGGFGSLESGILCQNLPVLFGVTFESNTYDIQIVNNAGILNEYGCNSENSTRHLYSPSGSGASCTVGIYSSRISPTQVNADGAMFVFNYRGLLVLIGNNLSDGVNIPGWNIAAPGAGNMGKVIAIGNTFPTNTPFVAADTIEVYSLGNMYTDGTGASQLLPDQIGPLPGNPPLHPTSYTPMQLTGMTTLQGYAPGVQTITASATLTTRSSTVISSGSGTTATLPAASAQEGQIVTYIRNDSANNQVLSTAGTDAFYGGATTKTLGSNGASVQVQSDGVGTWYIISSVGTVS